RLAGALRALIVEVGDRDTLRLVEAAEAIWRAEGPGGIRGTAARAEWRRRAAAAYRYLRDREPERLLAVRTALERYAKDIDAAGFTEPLLSESFRPGAVLRYAVRQSLSLVLGLPLAIWGIVN